MNQPPTKLLWSGIAATASPFVHSMSCCTPTLCSLCAALSAGDTEEDDDLCLQGTPAGWATASKQAMTSPRRWRPGVPLGAGHGEAMPCGAYRWQQMPATACRGSGRPGRRYSAPGWTWVGHGGRCLQGTCAPRTCVGAAVSVRQLLVQPPSCHLREAEAKRPGQLRAAGAATTECQTLSTPVTRIMNLRAGCLLSLSPFYRCGNYGSRG